MRIITVFLVLVHIGAVAQEWVQLPDFPGLARDDAATFTIDNVIYVGTGRDVGFQFTSDWYAYDFISMSWSQVASLPASGRQYASAFALNGKGYLFGGADANGPLDELWMYDPLADAWTERASLPAPARYACAAFADGTNGYICTGMLDGGTPSNEVWRYDPTANTWAARAPVPGPPRHRATGMIAVYPSVVGGATENNMALSDGYWYDPASDTWSAISDLPQPRFWANGAEEVLIGGATSFTSEHADVWTYDIFSQAWNTTLLPAFGGGPRRGGVAAHITFFDLGGWFFGLGLGNGVRSNDWWKLSLVNHVSEAEARQVHLFPNPADQWITFELPESIPVALYTVLDQLGRELTSGITSSGSRLNISMLAPGRYDFLIQYRTERLRTSFIKLP